MKKTESMMKKLLFAGSLTLCLCFSSLFVGQTAFAAQAESENLGLSCKSAYCMDANSATPVYAMNEKERLPIASMCKIMTLILSFDAVESGKMSYDTVVPVSQHAMSMGGSQVYLEAGGTYTAEQLMESVTVCSANDACVALAEYIAGSDDIFVQRMNDRAKGLGCNDTLFANCTGLPKDPQYSCAYDVALMLRELIKHDKYFEFSKIWTDEFQHPEGRTTLITNTNKLIRQYPYATGLKTGSTSQAKFCISATAEKDGIELIAVIMAAPDSASRNLDATALLNYGYAKCSLYQDLEEQPLVTVPVRGGVQEEVTGEYEGSFSYLSTTGEDLTAIEKKWYAVPELTAPVEEGQEIGKLTYTLNGQEIGSVAILADSAVGKAGYGYYVGRAFAYLLL